MASPRHHPLAPTAPASPDEAPRPFGAYDVVIVGAGSAGCVLANRLSADPACRVLLLEAGGRDNWIWFHVPVGYLYAIGNPRADWCFKTDAEPGLGGRALNYPRGKVLGGSSAINAMIYMRGQAADYDGWRQLGLEGWGWDDVLPLFRAMQDHAAPPADPEGRDLHGRGGEWRVELPRMRWPILDAVARAAVEAGIPAVDDFNRGNNEGVGYFHVNQRRGRRWSAARGFLRPALKRPNLRVVTGALVHRLVLAEGDGGLRARGVEFSLNGQTHVAEAAREVVLSAGAIGTPALLQRSGIGEGARLQALGVPVRRDLPGVGANLQDHLQLRLAFKVTGARTLNVDNRSLLKKALMGLEYGLLRTGPLTMAPSQLGAFARTSPDYETPNVQFHVQPLSLDRFGEPLHDFPAFTMSVCNLRPTSRGRVDATDADPASAPRIAPNYLSTAEDRRVAADAIRLARRIASQPALASHRPEEFMPGTAFQTEEELEEAAARIGTTIFHPVGTARMGPDGDGGAVLDARLRVRGVAGLRVADASAMPRITSGNTAAPTMMIAEKAARMMREEARNDASRAA